MALSVFTYDPVADPVGTTKYRVLKAQFGDGYIQTAADGINNTIKSWPLNFAGPKAQMNPIIAFFDGLAGWKAFLWTPPLGVQGAYRVSSYSLTAQSGDNYLVSATFEQAYKP